MKFFTTAILAALAFASQAIKLQSHDQALPSPTPTDPNGVTVVQPATNPTTQPTVQPAPQPVVPQPTVVQPTPVQPTTPAQPTSPTKPAETKPAAGEWTDADEKEFAEWEKNLIPVTIPALQAKVKENVEKEKQRRKDAKKGKAGK